MKRSTVAIYLFFVISVVLLVVQGIGGQESFSDNVEFIKVTVESGDTLWNLVRQANPDYNGDFRALVSKAVERNGSSNIQAQTVVEIPIVQR